MENIKMSVFDTIYSFVIGNHPKNTIFSFNYHNVRHIVSFLSIAIQNHLSTNSNIVVDIGAGRSPYYFLFSAKSFRYIAIDHPESLPRKETRPIEQLAGVAEDIPLSNDSVDVVLCNQVFEHVEDPIKVASEIFRILKPGGIFLGSAPSVSPIHLEPHDYWRFTEFGMKKLLNKVGFEDVYVEGNGGVHKCAAFMLSMDWFLSKKREGKQQQFYPIRALLSAPLIGLLNSLAILGDKIVIDKGRTPANLCWSAKKHI